MNRQFKRRLIFRLLPSNLLSLPILLNSLEQEGIDQGFEVIVTRTAFTPEEILPGDVYLFSFMTPFLPEIHREVTFIRTVREKHKEMDPNADSVENSLEITRENERIIHPKQSHVLIIGGGPHVTGEQELSSKLGFDVLFAGPGERLFPLFCKTLLENGPLQSLYKESCTENGEIDFERYIPVSKYINTIPPLEVMRGCYWHCKYCSTHQFEVKSRSIESIDVYLTELKRRTVHRVNFISPSSMEFGASKGRDIHLERIEELLELSKRHGFTFIEYGIFPSEIRPDTVTAKGLSVLKQVVANKYITIGAQSGLNTRLRELRRGHSVEETEEAIKIANSVGFSVQLDFIVGYPDETPEERTITVNFIKRINKTYKVRAHLHHFIPISGSPYALRLPSFLSEPERERLHGLRKAGIIIDGWVSNEESVRNYLEWLETNFSEFYSRYK